MKKWLFLIMVVFVAGLFIFWTTIFAEILIWTDDYCDDYLKTNPNENVVYSLIDRSRRISAGRQYNIQSECYIFLRSNYEQDGNHKISPDQLILLRRAFDSYRSLHFSAEGDADNLREFEVLLEKVYQR